MAILILLSLPVLFVILKFFFEKKSIAVSNHILTLLFLLYFACILLGIVNYYLPRNMFFRGYRSSTILFFVISFLGFIYNLVIPLHKKISFIKVILMLFNICSLSICSLLMFITVPNFKKDLIFSNSKYRIEEKYKFIKTPCGMPDIYVKKGIFEYRNYPTIQCCLAKEEIISVSIKEISSDSVDLIFYHTKDTGWHYSNPIIAGVKLNRIK